MSDKVEEALKAARSLREDLKKEADKLDSFAQKARVVQAVGSAASVVVTTAVLFGSGGSLSPMCMWAPRIIKVLGKVSTATSVAQSVHSIFKLQLDPRWEKLKLDLDNPEELRGHTIKISTQLIAKAKDILKALTSSPVQPFLEELEAAAKKAAGAAAVSEASKTQQLKGVCKSILNLVSLCVDVRDLIQVSKDLYNKAPTESAVLLRKYVDLLDKLIAVYEKML